MIGNQRLTGISSNHRPCRLILIGNGNLYPLLLESVVVSTLMPDNIYHASESRTGAVI
jgi:hypothetical protein